MLVYESSKNRPVLDFEEFGPFAAFLLHKRGLRSFQPTLLWKIEFTDNEKKLSEVLFTDSITLPGESITTDSLDLSNHTISYLISNGRSTTNTISIGFYVDVYNTIERIIYPWMKQISIFGIKDNTIQIDFYGFRMGNSKSNPRELVITALTDEQKSASDGQIINEELTRPCYLHYQFLDCFPTNVPEYTYDQQNQKWANVRNITFGFRDYDIGLLPMDSKDLYTGTEIFKNELNYDISGSSNKLGNIIVNKPNVYKNELEETKTPKRKLEILRKSETKPGGFETDIELPNSKGAKAGKLINPKTDGAPTNPYHASLTKAAEILLDGTEIKQQMLSISDKDRFNETDHSQKIQSIKDALDNQLKTDIKYLEPMAPNFKTPALANGTENTIENPDAPETIRDEQGNIKNALLQNKKFNKQISIKTDEVGRSEDSNTREKNDLWQKVTDKLIASMKNTNGEDIEFGKYKIISKKDTVKKVLEGLVEKEGSIKHSKYNKIKIGEITKTPKRGSAEAYEDATYLHGSLPSGDKNIKELSDENIFTKSQKENDTRAMTDDETYRDPWREATGDLTATTGEKTVTVGNIHETKEDEDDRRIEKDESWREATGDLTATTGEKTVTVGNIHETKKNENDRPVLQGSTKFKQKNVYEKKAFAKKVSEDDRRIEKDESWREATGDLTATTGEKTVTVGNIHETKEDEDDRRIEKDESWREATGDLTATTGEKTVTVGNIHETKKNENDRPVLQGSTKFKQKNVYEKKAFAKKVSEDDRRIEKDESWREATGDLTATTGEKTVTVGNIHETKEDEDDRRAEKTDKWRSIGEKTFIDDVSNIEFGHRYDGKNNINFLNPDADTATTFLGGRPGNEEVYHRPGTGNDNTLLFGTLNTVSEDDYTEQYKLKEQWLKSLIKNMVKGYITPDTPVYHGLRAPLSKAIGKVQQWFYKEPKHKDTPEDDHTEVDTHSIKGSIGIDPNDYTQTDTHGLSNEINIPTDDYTQTDTHKPANGVDIPVDDHTLVETHDSANNIDIPVDDYTDLGSHSQINDVNVTEDDYTQVETHKSINSVDAASDDYTQTDTHGPANNVNISEDDYTLVETHNNANSIVIDVNDYISEHKQIDAVVPNKDDVVTQYSKIQEAGPEQNDYVKSGDIKIQSVVVDANDVPSKDVHANEISIDQNDVVTKVDANEITVDKNDYVIGSNIKSNTISIDMNDYVDSKKLTPNMVNPDKDDVRTGGSVDSKSIIIDSNDTVAANKIQISEKTPDVDDKLTSHVSINPIIPDQDTVDSSSIKTKTIEPEQNDVVSGSVSAKTLSISTDDFVDSKNIHADVVSPNENDFVKGKDIKIDKEIVVDSGDAELKHDQGNVKTVLADEFDTPSAGQITVEEKNPASNDFADSKKIEINTVIANEDDFVDAKKVKANEVEIGDKDSIIEHAMDDLKEIFAKTNDHITEHKEPISSVRSDIGGIKEHDIQINEIVPNSNDVVSVENLKAKTVNVERSIIDFAKLIINERKHDFADSITSHESIKEITPTKNDSISTHENVGRIVERPIEPQSVGKNRDMGIYVDPHEYDHTRIKTNE